MKIEAIEIFTGKLDFEYEPIRRLEVKCEATNALMPAPTIDEANGRLRALAAKVGANAIIEVDYNSGVSFTSWKSLKATGLAVQRVSEEVVCEECAETIKRAAKKCRFCGADRSNVETLATVTDNPERPELKNAFGEPLGSDEPLKDNNNPAIIIGLVGLGLFLLMLMLGSAG